ncbi:MAG: hypothetical protein AVDCRST_MAG38-2048, partial [uncultured Solirubrobacteraceae bacterium]
ERAPDRLPGDGGGRCAGGHAGADQLRARPRPRLLPGGGLVLHRRPGRPALPGRADRRRRHAGPRARARVVLPGRRRPDRRDLRDQRPGHGPDPRRGRGDRGHDRRSAEHVRGARPLRPAGAGALAAHRRQGGRHRPPGRRDAPDHPPL